MIQGDQGLARTGRDYAARALARAVVGRQPLCLRGCGRGRIGYAVVAVGARLELWARVGGGAHLVQDGLGPVSVQEGHAERMEDVFCASDAASRGRGFSECGNSRGSRREEGF